MTIEFKLTHDNNPDLIVRVENSITFTTFERGSAGWYAYEPWLADGNIVKPYRTVERQVFVDSIQYKENRINGTEANPIKYPSLQDSMGDLFDAVSAGDFGEAAKTCKWYTDQITVKQAHPK